MTARYVVTAALLTGGCAARGVGVRAPESLATGVDASFRHRCFPTLARAKPAGRARCGFLDPYGAAMSIDRTIPDSVAGEGLCRTAEYPIVRARCRLKPPQSYRRYPGEGPAVTLQRVILCGSNWTEFGPNFGAGDRGRSNEIEGYRRRSVESHPTSPIFARISPASRVLDRNLGDLETAELHR